MDWKSGQWARRMAKAWRSLFGEGLLQRARATSMALLGTTAAVGLAIVAIGLNQGWPLVPGSSIPSTPTPRQGVAEATVAKGGGTADHRTTNESDDRGVRETGDDASAESGAAPAAGPAPGAAAAPTGSPPAPSKPAGGRSRSPAPHSESVPTSAPTPAPPPDPPAETEPPPVATTSEDPEESNVPPWSNGHGHAYGRGDEWDHGHSQDDHGGGPGGYDDD